MPSPIESVRFDAKKDEIDVLAGSLVSFLTDQTVMLLQRQIRRRGTRSFVTTYSIYDISGLPQPIDTTHLILTAEPVIDIEPKSSDCLIRIKPQVLNEQFSFDAL
jgi:ABC-type sulfate transport system substrate-binding protein